MQYREYVNFIRPNAFNMLVSLSLMALIWSGFFAPSLSIAYDSPIIGKSPVSQFFLSEIDPLSNVSVGISALFLVIACTLMIRTNSLFTFRPVRTILPAFFFLITSSLIIRPHLLNYGYVVSSLFAFIVFYCFKLCEGSSSNLSKDSFNIGMLMGVCTLLSPTLLAYSIPILIFSFNIKTLTLKTTCAYILGLLIIIFSFIGFVYVVEEDTLLENLFIKWKIQDYSQFHNFSGAFFLYIGIITILFCIAFSHVFLKSSYQSIKNRHESKFFCLNFVFSSLLILLGSTDLGFILPLYLFSGSFLLGQMFSNNFSIFIKILWVVFIVSSIAYYLCPTFNF